MTITPDRFESPLTDVSNVFITAQTDDAGLPDLSSARLSDLLTSPLPHRLNRILSRLRTGNASVSAFASGLDLRESR